MERKTRIFKEMNLGTGVKKYLAISYSQLNTFLQCPLRWKMYYLLGKGESSDTESTQLGTQVHSFIEEFCAKKQHGYEWSVGEATSLMEDKLDERTITFKEDEDEDIVWQHLGVAKSMVEEDKGLGALLKTCDVIAQELEFKLKFNLPFSVFYKGEELSSHESGGDAFVLCLDGRGEVQIDETRYELNAGDAIVMPARHPHAVFSKEKFKMLLTVVF